jgi:hypothetical protein
VDAALPLAAAAPNHSIHRSSTAAASSACTEMDKLVEFSHDAP